MINSIGKNYIHPEKIYSVVFLSKIFLTLSKMLFTNPTTNANSDDQTKSNDPINEIKNINVSNQKIKPISLTILLYEKSFFWIVIERLFFVKFNLWKMIKFVVN